MKRAELKSLEELLSILKSKSVADGNMTFSGSAITNEHIKLFYSYFRCRRDVYAKRANRPDRNGRINYYTQIDYANSDADNKTYLPLRGEIIRQHLLGIKSDGSDVIGGYPTFPDETCNFLVFDFDNHGNQADGNRPFVEAEAIRKTGMAHGIDVLVERSRSGRGAHVWLFFKEPVKVEIARRFGTRLLDKSAELANFRDFQAYDRMIPAQDYLPINRKTGHKGLGNMVALPLQGQSLKNGNSAFIDENGQPYANQWEKLSQVKKITRELLEAKLQEWEPSWTEVNANTSSKPWEKPTTSKVFQPEDVDGIVETVLADQFYVSTSNLKPRLQNQLRRLAAFTNPEFYKKQRLGFSTAGIPRIIFCGYDEDGYICLPRGLKDEIIENFQKSKIEYNLDDKRNLGQKINVKFHGELYPEQQKAAKQILTTDDGIVNATTAFGKTVLGAYLISKRKVNTLILVHTTEILHHWLEDLGKFLDIKEVPPVYHTPTGRKKRRSSPIGKIYNGRNLQTGIIDVAMVSSLGKPGDIAEFVKDYGMVIVDECHHSSAHIAESVIRTTSAKYRYGFTATPKRNDQMEKKIFMEFGDIIYQYTAKEHLEKLQIERNLNTRITNFCSGKTEIYELYQELIGNTERNLQICNDIQKLIRENKSVLVITKFRNHADELFKVCSKFGNIFKLTGGMKKSDRANTLDILSRIGKNEGMAIIATGQYIGEGFNYPRLDTMLLTVPISWSGNLEQYVGRLHRRYDGKTTVAVYDYLDENVPVFRKMYQKRLRTYRKLGYCG